MKDHICIDIKWSKGQDFPLARMGPYPSENFPKSESQPFDFTEGESSPILNGESTVYILPNRNSYRKLYDSPQGIRYVKGTNRKYYGDFFYTP